MGQDRDAAMGLSVKAMIFFEAKLLLLRKNDGKTVSHWEFPGADYVAVKISWTACIER